MVAGLFGCWFRVGGARPAVAGRVISIVQVSLPGEGGQQGARGRTIVAPPFAPEALGRVLREGQALGPRVCVFLCCVCARPFACFSGVWVYVCRRGVCQCLCTPMLEGVSLSARLLSVYVHCIFQCVIFRVCTSYVYARISESLCVCPSVCLCMCVLCACVVFGLCV